MEKIVNNDGYLRSRLMDMAQHLLNICNETGNSNIQLMTSSLENGKGITLVVDCRTVRYLSRQVLPLFLTNTRSVSVFLILS